MSTTQQSRKQPISFFGIMFDLLIDAALMGLGAVLYYQFMVWKILPITLSPALTSVVGGFENAVYIISGVPFLVGAFGMVRTFLRLLRSLPGIK